MARRSVLAVAGVAAAAMALAGCTGAPTITGTASPSATSDSAEPSLPFAGAPKVPSPLPESVLAGDPCSDALTPAQVKDALGIDAGGKPGRAAGLGRKCDWSNLEEGSHLTVFFVTETKKGLSGVYKSTQPQAVKWQPLEPIQGFPAVAYLTPGPDPKQFCTVSVGLADDLSVDIGLVISRAAGTTVDPCSVAPKAADAVVTTLRQKAGA